MKKVGIVTTFQNTNYGSKLQSYALQKKLRDLGVIGENIIWLKQTSNSMLQKLLRLAKQPSSILKIGVRKKYRRRQQIFQEYLEDNLNVSGYTVEQIKELENLNNSPYSYYICGSDQIWAPNLFNEYLFLSFITDRSKKISYAPSIGLTKIPEKLKEQYKNLINGIGSLSIREADGASFISDITGREATVVLDPTLLLTRDEWVEQAAQTNINTPYILCYFLGGNNEHRQWVEELSKKTGYQIIVLPFAPRDFYWGHKRVFEAGPKEFLGLINSAEIVCTDSYHGMLFSLNLNKEFYSFLRFKENEKLNQNSRILNFMEKLGIVNRIVDLNEQNHYTDINWAVINSKLELERKNSITFLENALGK